MSFASTSESQPRLVSFETLSNIWQIENSTAERTLYATTKLNFHGPNTSLLHNLGTNYQMYPYTRIIFFLFNDTFFVTKEDKSTRRFLCMQVFLSDKVYVKIQTMKSPSGFMADLKYFVKEVGSLEILLAYLHPYQKSKEVKDLCNRIGKTLRLLYQESKWENMVALYVGIFKEGVRKDMCQANSPMFL